MENLNNFNVNRVINLLRRQFVMNAKVWTVGFLAVSGALLGISLMSVVLSGGFFNMKTYTSLGMVLFMVGGYVLTSRIFNELQTTKKNYFYLTLPARNDEKLLSVWVAGSLLYSVVALSALFIVSLIISGSASLIIGGNLNLFMPFSEDIIRAVGIYMVTQTIFLLGAVYFVKNNFLKTLIAILIVYLIFFVIVVILMHTVIRPMDFIGVGINFQENMFSFKNLSSFLTYFFWIVPGPFFLFVSFLRLKERQA